MTINITMSGYEGQIPAEYREGIVSLPKDKSILDFILTIPVDENIGLVRPRGLSNAYWDEFESMVRTAWNSRNISLKCVSNMDVFWTKNAWVNKERIVQGHPIGELKALWNEEENRPHRTAIIVGNGPSLTDSLEFLSKGVVFSCWHAYHKITGHLDNTHYVAHCDVLTPFYDFEPARPKGVTEIITTPTASPEFLTSFPDAKTWVYLGQDCWHHGYIAGALGYPDQKHVVGTVTNLCAQAAIYAGYKKLIFLGCDMGCRENDHLDLEKVYRQEINRHGVTVYTNHIFDAYRQGLEHLALQHKGIEFYNASRIGVDIEGFKDICMNFNI